MPDASDTTLMQESECQTCWILHSLELLNMLPKEELPIHTLNKVHGGLTPQQQWVNVILPRDEVLKDMLQ